MALLYTKFYAHLNPSNMRHKVRSCLVSDMKYKDNSINYILSSQFTLPTTYSDIEQNDFVEQRQNSLVLHVYTKIYVMWYTNSINPCGNNFHIPKYISWFNSWVIFCEITLRSMPQNTVDLAPRLIKVMAWFLDVLPAPLLNRIYITIWVLLH